MKKTTVYLPDELKMRLERAARQDNVSEAELIRTAIDRFTRSTGRPQPTLPLFDAIGEPDLAERVDAVLAEGFGSE